MENRDPELEKNFILFTILAMAVIFGWMYFFAKPQQPKKLPQKPGTEQAQPGDKGPEPVLQGSAAEAAKPETPAMKPAKAAAPAPAESFPPKTVSVQSPLYEIQFSSRAAAPLSWKLKTYTDRVYFPYEVSLKWPPLEKINQFQPEPVELINPDPGKTIQLGSEIVINNISVPADAAWKVEIDKINVDRGPKELVFTLPLPEHRVTLKKIYTFYPDNYRADLKILCEGPAIDANTSKVDFGLSYVFEPLNRLARINFHGPLFYNNQAKIKRIGLGEMNKAAEAKLNNPDNSVQPLKGGTADYAGFTDSYFLTALLAPADNPFMVQSFYSGDPASLKDKNANKEYSMDVTFRPTPKSAAERILAEAGLYFGPKEKDILQSVRPTLGLTIDYGWFAAIAIPLMYALKYTNIVVKNYGWSIVILTIVLRMAMFPLTRKSQQSMKELQKLQPEMQKIRNKYPNDRMKQQEEIYALQRKYKINPLGGCLPMIIQIPIFFAFYKVLMVSIELRHAPWMLWITDLSSRDPLLILPVLMGASQFFMGRLTPTAGADPTQAKMMQLMPLFMTILLVYFPSGLLLYWTVSNMIGIGQQIYVNRLPK